MKVYLFSGLGADGRVFQHLQLPSHCIPIHIDYINALQHEKLQDYAKRILPQIDTTAPFCIIGVSFGGILACEIMEYVKPVKTILVSSIACRKELPILYKFASALNLHRFIPSKKVNKPNLLTYYIFGVKEKQHKKLLSDILTSSNSTFSKWAVREILLWKRKIPPSNITRIHGTKDRLLPINNFVPHYKIPKGGHLIMLQQAENLSIIIAKIIEE